MFFNVLYLFRILIAENRYKHEAMVDGEPVLFEILDTCPKVRRVWIHVVFGIDLDMNSQKKCKILDALLDMIRLLFACWLFFYDLVWFFLC